MQCYVSLIVIYRRWLGHFVWTIGPRIRTGQIREYPPFRIAFLKLAGWFRSKVASFSSARVLQSEAF
jgi:hypothetical protein